MSRELREIITDAREELRERVKNEQVDLDEPHDVIHEIADGSVPVYHHDLLKIASENNDMATNEPEIGPAFDGSPTPVNIIAANVFEAIYAGLWEEVREIQEEREEAESA